MVWHFADSSYRHCLSVGARGSNEWMRGGRTDKRMEVFIPNSLSWWVNFKSFICVTSLHRLLEKNHTRQSLRSDCLELKIRPRIKTPKCHLSSRTIKWFYLVGMCDIELPVFA